MPGYAVEAFKIQYATSANPGSRSTVPNLFRSTNASEWAADPHYKTTQMFRKTVTARYCTRLEEER